MHITMTRKYMINRLQTIRLWQRHIGEGRVKEIRRQKESKRIIQQVVRNSRLIQNVWNQVDSRSVRSNIVGSLDVQVSSVSMSLPRRGCLLTHARRFPCTNSSCRHKEPSKMDQTRTKRFLLPSFDPFCLFYIDFCPSSSLVFYAGNPPVIDGFPSQRPSNAESVLMKWRHPVA